MLETVQNTTRLQRPLPRSKGICHWLHRFWVSQQRTGRNIGFKRWRLWVWASRLNHLELCACHDGTLCCRSCTTEEVGAFLNKILKQMQKRWSHHILWNTLACHGVLHMVRMSQPVHCWGIMSYRVRKLWQSTPGTSWLDHCKRTKFPKYIYVQDGSTAGWKKHNASVSVSDVDPFLDPTQ